MPHKGHTKKKRRDDGRLDMTPMIDIVFQLIIFFIVTIVITDDANPDIILADAKQSPELKDMPDTTLVVEVDRHGRISIHGARLTEGNLKHVAVRRYNFFGEFPVIIRADKRTRHKDVRRVMDIMTDVGLWKINFVAIKEKKT